MQEVHRDKTNLLLINKADLLSPTLRQQWTDYLNKEGVAFAFFSAMEEYEKYKDDGSLLQQPTRQRRAPKRQATLWEERQQQRQQQQQEQVDSDSMPATIAKDEDGDADLDFGSDGYAEEDVGAEAAVESNTDEEENKEDDDTQHGAAAAAVVDSSTEPTAETKSIKAGSKNARPLAPGIALNTETLYTSESLLDLFRLICADQIKEGRPPTVGLVGYPNVGKSSTINALCKFKSVPVSVTPGRTKHFQTILLGDIVLCDCPGLVFPSFANTKAEMVCNGILPIDQLRDPIAPTTHVCYTIARETLECIYGIHIIKPAEDDVS